MPAEARFRAILPAVALVLLTGVACFWRLGGCGIVDLDEGLYSAAAREMVLTGDLIVPRVNGVPFYEKPPLAYWTAAACIRVLGRTEAAARLPSAAATALTAWLLVWWGKRRIGRRVGYLAGAVYLTSPLALGPARLLTMDAALCWWIAVAMVAAYEALHAEKCAWRWAALFGAACGLGVLAKGLPGVVFPAATAAGWAWLAEGRRMGAALKRLRPLLGLAPIATFLVVAVPWHVLAYRASGELFWGEYIVRQHFGRFRGGDTSHLAPFWFYIPVFFAGFFPWSVFAPPAFLRAVRQASNEAERRAATFLVLWALLVFVAFSASGSKLVSYIMPMLAPTALLIGWWWACALDAPGGVRRAVIAGTSVSLVLAGILFSVLALHAPIIAAVERSTHKPIPLDANTLALILLGEGLFLVAALTCCIALVPACMGHVRAVLVVLAGGMAAFVSVAVAGGISALDRTFTAPLHSMVALAADQTAPDGALLLNVGSPRRPSVLYYLPDDFLTDAARARGRLVEDGSEAAASSFLAAQPGALAVMPLERAEKAVGSGAGEMVARTSKWAVVRAAGRASP